MFHLAIPTWQALGAMVRYAQRTWPATVSVQCYCPQNNSKTKQQIYVRSHVPFSWGKLEKFDEVKPCDRPWYGCVNWHFVSLWASINRNKQSINLSNSLNMPLT
jgi:hypothetical protein